MKKKVMRLVAGVALSAATTLTFAAATSVTINQIDANGSGKVLGTVKLQDSDYGLVVITNLTGLSAGDHGFHFHENGDCSPKEKDGKPVAGLAAGGHFDPHSVGKHEGPHGRGHLGDLPPLVVDKAGNAKVQVIASRLKVADVKGRAMIIHEGGDNFSDDPKPLGGGGARIACGVVK